jgi:hypothetical protein
MGICVACCKCRQKAKCRTIKTKEQVRMKYREYKKKKIPLKSCRFFFSSETSRSFLGIAGLSVGGKAAEA